MNRLMLVLSLGAATLVIGCDSSTPTTTQSSTPTEAPAATEAPTAPAETQQQAGSDACSRDAANFCPGVEPGEGRIAACLNQHKDKLTDACRKSLGM